MRDNGQPSVVPAPTGKYENIPMELKRFVLPEGRVVVEE